ncbi:uncharacterized protein LOC133313973 [Gastrolobium bilobum]|uniref:uncharacterized protein LOC133313973 n=1 Tax=Gastrolobium bilobum TaxID=150636 RepID=UPI002AAF4A1B|nr:uncharacterized protein LOC133313973 [Gastrolobium bilobum]
MKNALKAKKKTGFIDGSITKPDKVIQDEWSAWEMCNSMINGWIHNIIDAKLQPFIKCFDDVKDLWEDLKERYVVQNFPKQYQLRAALTNTRQQGSTIGEYYTKLRAIWDELEGCKISKSCACGDNCAVAKEIEEGREHEHVYQFLMGLDEASFGNLRSQILNTSPPPTLNKVYATVTQEETHRTIARGHDDRSAVIGYAARIEASGGRDPNAQRMLADQLVVRTPCPHCGKTNHDPSRCWKIIVFPPIRGATRGRGKGRTGGRGSHKQAYAMQTSDVPQPANASSSPTIAAFSVLTSEVVHKLMTLVDNSQTNQTTDKLSGKATQSQWLVDSGASQHMTGTLDLLTDVRKIKPLAVGLPNGAITHTEQQGTMVFNNNFILSDVLFVPHLRHNLISVSQLLQQSNNKVIFTNGKCILQDQALMRETGLGDVHAGVYVFQPKYASVSTVRVQESAELWHRRFSHPSYEVVSLLPLFSHVSAKIAANNTTCAICCRAKHTRTMFHSSSNRTAIDAGCEPRHFREAMQNSKWVDAMRKEITALEDNRTWAVTVLPSGRRALPSKWVFKIKYHSDGTVERYKARLVIAVNHQIEGEDYGE